ncbi:MAG TPA: hypothetical protein VM261_18930 [Kofleriaceae bacterium]|nr:hypothetical protein [Kofleriaceae bacterium]
MSIRGRFVLGVFLVAVACGYQDVKGSVKVQRAFKVKSVSAAGAPLELVLVPDDCATEEVVIAAGVAGAETRHSTDLTCLAKLQPAAAIEHVKQREKQGCIPGVVYYDKLGGCALGPLAMTSRGTRCTPAAPTTP